MANMKQVNEPKTGAERVAAYRERRKTRSIDVDGQTFDRLTAYKTERGLTISGAIDCLLSAADGSQDKAASLTC